MTASLSQTTAGYYDAKDRRLSKAAMEAQGLLTPVRADASPCIVMAGGPRLDNRMNNKVMWPARLATPEEAHEFRRAHGLPAVRACVCVCACILGLTELFMFHLPPSFLPLFVCAFLCVVEQKDESSVVVVLLCWGMHHTFTVVKREYCRRVTPEDVEFMLTMWMVSPSKSD